MRLFLLSFFLFLSASILGQAPAIQWAKTYGGSNAENVECFQPTPDGGYIVGGYSYSKDGDLTSNRGKSDLWVAKLSSTGNIEWQKSYGGSGDERANSVRQTMDGGYIIAGTSNSPDGDVKGWHSGILYGGITSDVWVLKLSAGGNIEWQQCYGGTQTEEGFAVTLSANSGYIITGTTQSNDGDVSGIHSSPISPYSKDLWVVELNAVGSIQWQKCFGGGFDEIGRSILQTSDGGYIIGGYTDSYDGGDVFGNHHRPNSADYDYWILKLDMYGILQWQKCLGGNDPEICYSVIQTSDGGYIAVGSAMSKDGDVTGIHSLQDCWVTKLSNTGAIQWQKTYGGLNDETGRSIEPTSDGGYIIGVSTASNDGQVSGNHGNSDYWILKINSTGNIEWQKCLGGSQYESAASAKVSADGGYIIAGTTNSFDGDVMGNHGTNDFWIVKLREPLCTGTINISTTTTNVCNDSSVTFISSVTNGGTNPVYQWKVNGVNAGINSSSFTTSSLHDYDSVVCILTSNASCISNSMFISNTIIMHVSKCPAFPQPTSCESNTFQKLYGRINGYEQGQDIIETPELGFMAVGFTGKGLIMKINKYGAIVWQKDVDDGKNSGMVRRVIRLRDGNYIGLGRAYYPDFQDSWIMKFDGSGNIIWNKVVTIPSSLSTQPYKGNEAYDICETSDGGLAISGSYAPFANTTGPFIFKLDANGNYLWGKNKIASSSSVGITERNGVLYVVGKDYGSWSGTIMKLRSSDGTILGGNTIQVDNKNTSFHSIELKKDKFYIDAYNTDNQSFDGLKQVILILDTNLNILKAHKFNFSFREEWEIPGMFPTDDGGFIATECDDQNSDILLFKVSYDGVIKWQRKYPRDGQQKPYNIKPTAGNGIIGIARSERKEDYYNYADILIFKTDSLGLTPDCTLENPSMSITSPTYTNYVSSFYLDPLTLQVFPVNSIIAPASLPVLTYCENIIVPTCNTIKLTGKNTICLSEPVTYTANRNKNCNSTVTWNIDTTFGTVTSLTDSTAAVQFKKEGIVKIFSYITTSCEKVTDSLEINILNSPATLNLGPDTVLCPGNTVLLNAKKGFATYQWQDGSTDSTFTVTQPGTYFVKTTNACGGIFYDTVLVSPHPPIPFDIGPDLSKCNGDTLTISLPTGFLNFIWTPSYNNITTNPQAVIVFPSTDTIYMVKAEKTPGCFAYDSIRIKVYTSPNIDLGPDKSLCSGDSVILNAGTGFNKYLWSTGSSSQQIVVKNAGSYSITATTINNCSSKDTLSITAVYPNPIVTLDHDSTLCAGTARTLNAGNFSSYLWNTGNTSQTISLNNIGVYYVTVTDINNCKGSDTTKIVTMLPSPSNFLPADTAVCSYSSLQLTSKITFAKYLWNTNALTRAITITQPGVYWLQVRDKNNCSGRDSITVAQKDCMKGFYIPNAFSPNHDGKNDLFRPMLFGKVILYEFTIYNQWGEIVFKSTDVNRGWDGSYKKLPQDTFVFVWICKYQFENEPVKTERGSVLLLR